MEDGHKFCAALVADLTWESVSDRTWDAMGEGVVYRIMRREDGKFHLKMSQWEKGDPFETKQLATDEANRRHRAQISTIMKHDLAQEVVEALLAAELAVEQLCVGQDPANECWETLRKIRAAIAKAGGK